MIMELWIARDKDGTLSVTDEKPILSISKSCWLTPAVAECLFIDCELFPEVTFENSPKKVELIIVEDGTKPI